MIKNIILIIIIFMTMNILLDYKVISICIQDACTLFFRNIFPSLFPMFLISSLLIDLDFIKYINIIFKKINSRIFKINSNTSYILFMSMISGCPSNAKISKDMYDKNLISKLDIQKIILFSHFTNPIFILNTISHRAPLVLMSHYVSNFIIGFIFRNKYVSNEMTTHNLEKNKYNFSQSLSNSINKAISTLLFILGTIVTFYIISTILNIPIFNAILELSYGLNYLEHLNISLKIKTILLGALLSFGGVCIHFQIYGILNELKIKYLPYLFSRLLQCVLTATIIYILY